MIFWIKLFLLILLIVMLRFWLISESQSLNSKLNQDLVQSVNPVGPVQSVEISVVGPVGQSCRSSKLLNHFRPLKNTPSDWLYICILVLHAEIENQISQLMIRTDRGWQCGQPGCDYVANKWSLRNHIESKHIDIGGIQCDRCSKVCPTRHALTMHIKRNHSF